ncbi:MAG: flavodoxin family protein [Deferribacteraceae bacterium]|jgi:multimeric flavodoxin WrbA|nr:flavodoxin family protein [Deferribacteraceae bacterium]
MKVAMFNGSARKGGNTHIMLGWLAKSLAAEGIDSEITDMGGLKLHGCAACSKCFNTKNRRCTVNDDMNGLIAKMDEADGIVLASPTYFADVTAEMKALIDRAGFVGMANDNMYRRKCGASVAVARRGGAIHTFDTMNHFFQISQVYIVSSCYWNMGYGRQIGEITSDKEGEHTMDVLGQNMAWLLKKIHGEK